MGYGFIFAEMVVFLIGFTTAFPEWTVGLSMTLLAGATLTLAPSLVVGYAVKAAAREDRRR